MTRPCASLNWYDPGVSGMEPVGGLVTIASAPADDVADDGDDLVLLVRREVCGARQAEHGVGDLHRDVAAEHLAVAVRLLDPHRRPDRSGLDAFGTQRLAYGRAGAVVGQDRSGQPARTARPRLVGTVGDAEVGECV